jgi:hypothetical protein
MKTLNEVIQKYADTGANALLPDLSLGSKGKKSEKPLKNSDDVKLVDREGLRADLEIVKRDNQRYFWICVFMIIVLYAVSLIVVLTNLERPDLIKIIMGIFGISTSGLIWMMIKLWREKSNTEYLLALAINMDIKTLTKIVNLLATRLPK